MPFIDIIKNISEVKSKSNMLRTSSNVPFHFRYTDHVSVDDEVLIQRNHDLVPSKLVNVKTTIAQG